MTDKLQQLEVPALTIRRTDKLQQLEVPALTAAHASGLRTTLQYLGSCLMTYRSLLADRYTVDSRFRWYVTSFLELKGSKTKEIDPRLVMILLSQ